MHNNNLAKQYESISNNMKIKNFALIIGAMKCGTTSIFNYLSEHPEVSACKNKEYNFFACSENFPTKIEFYQSLWDWNQEHHKIALQAPTNHTRITHPSHVNAAKNIAMFQKETNTNFKFIYAMRNPIDRIESHYNHILAGCEMTQKELSSEVRQEAIDTSKYAMQLAEFSQRFNQESFLLLNFDELKYNPQNILKKICQFLEIDDNYQFNSLSKIYNQTKTRKIISNPAYRYARKNSFLRSFLNNMPNKTREKLIFSIRNVVGKDPTYIKLTQNERQFLLQILSEDLYKLKNDYHFDFSSWNLNI